MRKDTCRNPIWTKLVAACALFILSSFVASFALYQPATSTAVMSPTVTETSSSLASSASPAILPTEPVILVQEIATATAAVEGPGLPSGSMLDRLTFNKPGIWGNEAFYVGLGAVYVVLVALFLVLVYRGEASQ